MICITQGHEKSISLEVFLKSLLHLTNIQSQKILFFVNKESLTSTLLTLKWKFEILNETLFFAHKSVQCKFTDKFPTESTCALLSALSFLEKNKGILFTLPTTKDQLILNDVITSGHTEFFRKYFKREYIGMLFSGPLFDTFLITDHIPLKDVTHKITSDLIISKIKNIITSQKKYERFYFSGLNPHCGENGLLGTGDEKIIVAINKLKLEYPKMEFIGPFSGDIIHKFKGKNSLLVYMNHDQGLAPFKLAQSFFGSNISIGLPFLRFSPDHGTAMELYGKNKASHSGCLYSLKEAIQYHG